MSSRQQTPGGERRCRARQSAKTAQASTCIIGRKEKFEAQRRGILAATVEWGSDANTSGKQLSRAM
eukprot:scaffold53608_cov30-Tisochrysis_lutea.AAC.5